MKYYLAVDIGASSGRHIVGWRENGEIRTEEVYRFPNGVKEENGHLVWDIRSLFENVKAGIGAAFEKFPKIESLSIDTWGCDYVLMRGEEEVLPCYAYRDHRTDAAAEKVHKILPFEALYRKTGIQFQPFNTIYQLYDDKERNRLRGVTDFLMIPEYLNYKLTGVRVKEYTNATTTGLVNAQTKQFDKEIVSALSLPEKLFPTLKTAGTKAGRLKEEIASEVGGNTQAVLCATHDTGSAVEGIPLPQDTPYISSGTWSLLGVKTPEAIVTRESRKQNWSNEGGIGYIRYQKNIMGMWIVNRLKAELCPGMSFEEIEREAKNSDFYDYADVNLPVFLAPESMKEAFDEQFFSAERKPRTTGDYFRCAFTSLAMCYTVAIEELERNTGKTYREIYIVGGGAKNGMINALTEQTAKKKVVALPIEATALGNLKIQMRTEECDEL